MTVERLRHDMSGHEYLHWQIYYARKAQRAQLEMLKAKGGRA